MNRLFLLAGAIVLAAVAGTSVRAEDEGKGTPTKAIMKKVHGKGGLQSKVSAALKEKKSDEAAEAAKEWFELAKALTKNPCKKGDGESWKKLTGTYCVCVKTLNEAIEAKDAKRAQGAMGKIGSMCKTCHTAHR